VAAAESTMSKVIPDIYFDDMMFEKTEESYNEGVAYGQSKLANYLHAMEAGKRYPADKLISMSVHPGWVQSNLDIHIFTKVFGDSWFGKMAADMVRQLFLWKGDMISVVDGVQTSLHCVLEDADKMESGAFYSQFGIYKEEACKNGGWPMTLPNSNATPEKAAKLWEESEKLVGL
jgi:hypothetical protein